MELVLIPSLLEVQRLKVVNQLLEKLARDSKKTEFVYLCKNSQNEDAYNPIQWIISLCRKLGLLPSQRTTIIPVYNQQQLLQLSLAKSNKKSSGVFETTASDVLNLWKFLFKEAVSGNYQSHEEKGLKNNDLAVLLDAKEEYSSFLASSFCIDHFSLLRIIREKTLDDNRLFTDLLEDTVLVFIGDSDEFSALELEFFKLLFKKSKIYQANIIPSDNIDLNISGVKDFASESIATPEKQKCVEEPVDFTEEEKSSVSEFSLNVEKLSISSDALFKSDEYYGCQTAKSPHSSYGSTLYVEQIFLSHLRLILNSRDDLAVACLLSMPGRDLSQKAFNAIQKVAERRKQPVFLAIWSMTLRLRLGRIEPDPSCPIVQNEKILSEFADKMCYLESMAYEIPHHRAAATKTFNWIKLNLTRMFGRKFKLGVIEHVHDWFLSKILHESIKTLGWDQSPQRKCSSSSSSIQTIPVSKKLRPCLLVFLSCCDICAGRNLGFRIEDAIGEQILTQRTPVESSQKSFSPVAAAPSILNLFKSPDSPSSKDAHDERTDNTPLRVRLMKRKKKLADVDESSVKTTTRYRSCHAWAPDDMSPISIAPLATPIDQRPHWKDVLNELPNDYKEEEPMEIKTIKKGRKRKLLTDLATLEEETTDKRTNKEKVNKCGKKQNAKKANNKKVPKNQPHITSFFK